MKYDPDKSFGYPVLTRHSDDYIKSTFQTEIGFDINPSNPREFIIEYELACSVPEIREFVKSGNAAYWIKISCRKTFYSKLIEVNAIGTLVIEGKYLRDVVDITGYIIAKKDSVLSSAKINPEFGYSSFEVINGQVLAQGVPVTYVTEKEFWKPLSSIFQYKPSDDLKDGEFTVDLDDEYVWILAQSQQLKKFEEFSQSQEGKIILLNTVFFAALIHMIDALNENAEQYSEKKWAKILLAKAASKNVNLNNARPLLATQQLLDKPLRNLLPEFLDK
jgi:hypothetical protein